MAERRMFAKTVVLSDAFLDLPMSARCLYFTLGMSADDDGFVNAPRAVMRQCGASGDDMKILLAKKYVLLFDSGVIVVRHWRINNYLRGDRYIPTKCAGELAELRIDGQGVYHRPEDGIPGTVDPGKDSSEKGRSNKGSIEEGNIEEADPARIAHFRDRAAFFRRQGWDPASVYALASHEGITKAMLEEVDGNEFT